MGRALSSSYRLFVHSVILLATNVYVPWVFSFNSVTYNNPLTNHRKLKPRNRIERPSAPLLHEAAFVGHRLTERIAHIAVDWRQCRLFWRSHVLISTRNRDMFCEVVCGFIQPLQVPVRMEFIPLYCGRLAVICVLPSNTTNFLNPTVHAKCFGRFRPSAGTEVQNLKPTWARVRSISQFLRSHGFYHYQKNTGLFYLLFLAHLFYLLLQSCPIIYKMIKIFLGRLLSVGPV